ncbi:glycerophosphodiester phosphodiesterase [Paenibacillus sp. YYML68]|uniref:glycerophosphodiester phosphodiesterase n=1 Tax=Paenibacillus sp. YYML68 TaxID=2909250 RepID=UPI00249280CE|nr:glycerophosphodiester phosphodiesterase [Paenibacillus sp. YYML68]
MEQQQSYGRPLIIGHRGAAGEAPENTLASFKLAIEQGADALELDVHESADGDIIVCHDHTVDRTTDGTGRIDAMLADELRKLDAGAWFSPSYAGERVPLLAEVFAAVPQHIMINVEIKCDYSARLSIRLLQLLVEYGRMDSVVVSSFNHKTLLRLKHDHPALRIGLLYVGDLVHHAKLADISGMDVYSLHPHYAGIGAEDVQEAVRCGLKVYPYTINEPQHLQQAIAAGCTGIITDYPARLKQLLDDSSVE